MRAGRRGSASGPAFGNIAHDDAGGADLNYVTTQAPLPGAATDGLAATFGDSQFQRWTGTGGTLRWRRASVSQQPITFAIGNGLAHLPMHGAMRVERVRFPAPGIAVATSMLLPVEAV